MEQSFRESNAENMNTVIRRLIETLSSYDDLYAGSSQELKDEWYDIEMEAEVGGDREAAKGKLEKFIAKLEDGRK